MLSFIARYPLPAGVAALGMMLAALGFAQQGYDLWQSPIEAWHLQAAGALLIVLWLAMMLYRWEQEHMARLEAQPVAAAAAAPPPPPPQPQPVQTAITSHNQSGGVTAQINIGAGLPKPKLRWGEPVTTCNKDDSLTVTIPFDVIAPYPPGSLYLKVKTPGIQDLKVGLRGRSGAFMIAEKGQGDGWRSAILQHPMGAYQAQVVTTTTKLECEHKFNA